MAEPHSTSTSSSTTASTKTSTPTTSFSSEDLSGAPGEARPLQQYPRVDTRMKVRISTIDPEADSQGKPFFRSTEERCFDISRGGTYVMTPDPIEPGLRVLLELDIPGGDTVQTLARVVWTRVEQSGTKPAGVGVEFLGGRSGQFLELEKHLARARRWSAAKRLEKRATPLLQEIL